MNKIFKVAALTILVVFMAAIGGLADYNKKNFLTTAIACAASTTLVNGVDFTSVEISTKWERKIPAMGALTITFTRAAGSSSEVNFEFQASTDDKATWSTVYYVKVCVPTNETAVSNVVRVTKEVQFWGVTHVRLYRIVNNDASNNLTACNASLSW